MLETVVEDSKYAARESITAYNKLNDVATPDTPPSTLQPESEKETPMEAYCFKCRSKREIAAPQRVTLKNGNPAVTGKCPECSCKMFRMVAREVPQ
jgi:hypothetical protein